MNDIICPVCAKPNSNTLDVCQYCGADLKKSAADSLPLLPQNDQASQSAHAMDFLAGLSSLGDEEEETPDWLKNLQSSLPAPLPPEPPKKPQQASPTEDPFGLGIPSEQSTKPEKDQGFDDQTVAFQFGQDSNSASHPDDAPSEWLDPFKTQADNSASAPSGEPSASEANRDPSVYADLPDWLAKLTGPITNPVSSQPETASPKQNPNQTGSLDWLSDLGGDFTSEESARPPQTSNLENGETSDWLARMGTNYSSSAEPGHTDEPPASDDTPDWMASLQNSAPKSTEAIGGPVAPKAPAALPSDDTPDWMSSLQGFSFTSSESSNPPEQSDNSAVAPFEDVPDWLSNLKSSESVDSAPGPETSEESAVLPTDNMADWLVSFNDSAPAESVAPTTPEAPPAFPASDIPDWLSSMRASAPPESVATPETPQVTAALPAEDIPDWLSNLQDSAIDASAAVPETPEAPAAPAPPSQDTIPGRMETPDRPKSDKQASQQKPFDTGSLSELGLPEGDSEIPDWLASINKAPSEQKKPAQSGIGIRSPLKSETPGAAPEKSSKPAQTGLETGTDVPQVSLRAGEQNIDSILSMETPDWLSSLTPTDKGQKGSSEQPPSAGELPQGELPSWVQAMRPMESVMQETSDDGEDHEVEKQGPLTGLRSVLPTQALPVGLQSGKAYPLDILASETQQAQAALLQNLLDSENSPRVSPKRPKPSKRDSMRWLIAAVLVVVILGFATFGSSLYSTPLAPSAAEPVGSFVKAVTDLPDGAPVLVVTDYQPGFAGEMEVALGPAIEQLMSKKARLAFVYTLPMGDWMAKRLLLKFANDYPYQEGLQYVILGYLPGGASGIRAFADQPAEMLGRYTLAGNLWNSPVLNDVGANSEVRLSDFAAVIVATDNPETGRLWIEQAKPVLASTPMLMVVSAQAQPMLLPYFNSKQLSGLVAGLQGGMLYESALGKFGMARAYLDSFGAGILVIELIILIGGVWSLVTGLRARRVEMEQDES